MPRIYLDTSAVAKLFIAEEETSALREWMAKRRRPTLVSSALLAVELIRLLGKANPAAVAGAESFLSTSVDLVDITSTLLSDATYVAPPALRALDAIHLATAMDLGDAVDVMLTYDKQLAHAATAAGLTVAHPGVVY